jgi:hypothetical protein
MTSILLIGLAIALALYLLLTRIWLSSRDEPRKAKKQEKAEIMRQLLALSDLEQSIPATPSPMRSVAPRTNRRAQPGKLDTERMGLASSSRKP